MPQPENLTDLMQFRSSSPLKGDQEGAILWIQDNLKLDMYITNVWTVAEDDPRGPVLYHQGLPRKVLGASPETEGLWNQETVPFSGPGYDAHEVIEKLIDLTARGFFIQELVGPYPGGYRVKATHRQHFTLAPETVHEKLRDQIPALMGV